MGEDGPDDEARLTKKATAAEDETNWSSDPEAMKLALDYAWNWFALHADHRMRAVHFFLLASTFLTAGFGAALNARHWSIAVGVGAAGAALTVVFFLFEIRIRELLKAGEAALKPLESSLAKQHGASALRIVSIVEEPRVRWSRYSRVIGAMYATAYVGWIAATIYAGLARG